MDYDSPFLGWIVPLNCQEPADDEDYIEPEDNSDIDYTGEFTL
jgi:hypothetical protein